VKTDSQIKRRIVDLTFERANLALMLDGKESVELRELDAAIAALFWVIGNKQFDGSKYGA